MSNDIKLKDYLNQSVNDYLRESYINSYGTWVTDAEMMATVSLLGTDIVVHSKVVDRTSDFAIYLQNLSEHLNLVISVQ